MAQVMADTVETGARVRGKVEEQERTREAGGAGQCSSS